VYRHRNEDVATGACTYPATGDCLAEWYGKALLARVLQVVERPPDGAPVWRAPLELEDSRRQIGREADGRPRREVEPGVELSRTSGAHRLALDSTPGALGRQREIEGSAGDTGKNRQHALDLGRQRLSLAKLRAR
jgi:hypothetical protein